jgi:RNA polymerase sigma factor (sigma-70 family)
MADKGHTLGHIGGSQNPSVGRLDLNPSAVPADQGPGHEASSAGREHDPTATRAEQRNRAFEAALPLIKAVIDQTARRHLLSRQDQEDLRSYVFLKLLEDDARRLKEFRGESSFRTYLLMVVKHLYVDLRVQQRGKWRSSAAARRGGDLHERIEELFYRDGYTASQAYEYVTTNLGLEMTRGQYDEILSTLRRQVTPRVAGDEFLDLLPDDRWRPDAPLLAREMERREARVREAWEQFWRLLSGEDRLIWALHCDDHVKSSRIAKALGCPVEHVYASVDRTKRLARKRLACAGITSAFLQAGQGSV